GGWCNCKVVLTVEHTRGQKVCCPSELFFRLKLQDFCVCPDSQTSGKFEAIWNRGTRAYNALNLQNKRVPLRVASKIRKDLPYPQRRRIDLDFGPNLLKHVTTSSVRAGSFDPASLLS